MKKVLTATKTTTTRKTTNATATTVTTTTTTITTTTIYPQDTTDNKQIRTGGSTKQSNETTRSIHNFHFHTDKMVFLIISLGGLIVIVGVLCMLAFCCIKGMLPFHRLLYCFLFRWTRLVNDFRRYFSISLPLNEKDI